MIEKCAQCGKEIDLKKEASSKCDKCHKVFCCCLWTECFDEHRIVTMEPPSLELYQAQTQQVDHNRLQTEALTQH